MSEAPPAGARRRGTHDALPQESGTGRSTVERREVRRCVPFGTSGTTPSGTSSGWHELPHAARRRGSGVRRRTAVPHRLGLSELEVEERSDAGDLGPVSYTHLRAHE